MAKITSDIAFTTAVKAVQEQMGSRRGYAAMEQKGGWSDRVSGDLEAFVAERDSFYFGTTSAEGRPYIQHRGGPPGFLRVIGERALAFADYSGNKQYISVGNLSENDQAFIFLMDYPNRQRIKIWGRAEVVDDDPALFERLADSEYGARPERAIVFHVEAWDVNCPQHIRPRFTAEDIAPEMQKLQDRIRALESELESLKNPGEHHVSDPQDHTAHSTVHP